jgi:hypothetical protein
MSERSIGLYIEVDTDEGRQLGVGIPRSVEVRVGTKSDQYVNVAVTDDGTWVLVETSLSGTPRILARGQLPSSRFTDDRGIDWRR